MLIGMPKITNKIVRINDIFKKKVLFNNRI